MKVEFEIISIPEGEQKKYPTAYLEGLLKIMFNDIIFLISQEYCLLSLQY